MVSPAEPLDIKKRGKSKSPLNSIPERAISPSFNTDRINNINRLVSPPNNNINRLVSPPNNNINRLASSPLNNINRLASPPLPGVQHLSKSQPKASYQNKLEPFANSSGSNGRFPGSYSFGSVEPNPESYIIHIPKERKAEIVKKHLVTDEEYARSYGSYENTGILPDIHYSSSHKLPGGDATHEVYKWQKGIENEPMKRTRSRSLYIPRPHDDPDTSNIREPGGFRRHHVLMKARKAGKEPNIITRNFIDFLAMYGHFAGEDLSDDEGDDDDDDDDDDDVNSESTPLIQRDGHANASPSKAVFLLLKSFVGTGVMFLPKAFYNGGMVFSLFFLVGVAAVSLCAFLLLVQTRFYIPYSFGDIGGVLYGRWMRLAVLFSITLSQIGFVCAYMIFVAQNIGSVVSEVTGIKRDVAWYLMAQLVVFMPLAMIRRISKLSLAALIADAFIMFGLLYLYYYDISLLATQGMGKIKAFNPSDFALFIGTAVFTFEGIGLIIPITESMKEPEKFPKVLTGVMIFITIIFTSIGVLSYAAFGEEVETVVILNLPAGDPVVQAVQFLYALAILLSIPLQLFPALRIMEQGLFEKSGKDDRWVKWQKNVFRCLTVIACGLISYGGSRDLDKFVSLIGSLACVPLCFLYPPLFHFKAAAHTLKAKLLDIFIFMFGLFSLFYTSYVTLAKWGEN
ncbi:hypothetical protein Glove_437g32 [Diversispora epigaea]|uniref:Amino acid transporter transmembrane domain-containing protein n=1 Tax=Diversispora epigaea TaxID=1348612 RepID=A0A397GT41_9GLOM|nr:hypothetical protein Glove_437g32 [Diversispora epigaea]